MQALDAVDLAVAPGEVHGLLGPNGAGKSTLLRVLLGLVRPDAGGVRLFGREHGVDGVDALEGVAGFVDRPQWWPYLTARRTLELLASADARPTAPVAEVLDAVDLLVAADRKVRGWSTGMRQRLGVAAALLRRPRLLVLDEPAEGLDPVAAGRLRDLLARLAADGVAILLASHDMAEVEATCDRATVLHRGRVVAAATIGELRAGAPLGRQRLHTSDDRTALALAAAHAVRAAPHTRGGVALEASPGAMHDYVCALGRADVSVVRLEQEVAPLAALFAALTGEHAGSPAPDPAPVP